MTLPLFVRRSSSDWAVAAAAFGAGIVLLALFLGAAGFQVGPALGALWDGALGSWYNFTSATLVRAIPLIILGLAFALGNQGGVLNIGMEGQFAAGAIGATWAGLQVGDLPAAIAICAVLLAGLISGAAWVAVPVMLRTRFGVSEVVSTLLLNFVGAAAVSFGVTGPLQEPSRVYPQSAPIASSAELPMLLPGSRLHLGLVIAVVLATLLSLLLNRTAWGFRLRAVGAGPRAAFITGRMPITAIAAAALCWSGALAGLGGAVEVAGVSHALYQNLSPGYGFTAIAVALLGRLQPGLVVVAGVLFGALEAGAAAMQRDAGIPAVAAQVVEAVVLVVMLVSARQRN